MTDNLRDCFGMRNLKGSNNLIYSKTRLSRNLRSYIESDGEGESLSTQIDKLKKGHT